MKVYIFLTVCCLVLVDVPALERLVNSVFLSSSSAYNVEYVPTEIAGGMPFCRLRLGRYRIKSVKLKKKKYG